MDLCLQLLKKRNNSRFDSYSVRNRLLIISNITFRDCRVHIFSDHLSRNSCTHYTEELFVTTWKAICRYRRHSNGSELGEQVIHTYRITNRNDWPRRFGEPNPSPHSWIFNSVSVDSSPLSYLFTSAKVPIPVPTAPEIWHFQVFKSQFLHPWISRTVISVTKRSCAAAFSSSFLLFHSCYGPNTCSHCTEVWHRTYPICDAPLSRTARRSFASLQQSPFLWVNRSPIWYGFRAGAKAIWYTCSVNMGLATTTTTATGTSKITKTTTLHVWHPVLYISLPSLHDYHVKFSDVSSISRLRVAS